MRVYKRVTELEPGMIIDQSIIDESGHALIYRGTVLDKFIIVSLKQLGFSSVYVKEGEEGAEIVPQNVPSISKKAESVIEKTIVSDRNKIELHESVKRRISESIEYIYNHGNDDFSLVAKSVTNELMETIMSNSAIAFDIDSLRVNDEYTYKHSVDVAAMAMIVAKNYGLSTRDIHDIGTSGLLHDIGKSRIPIDLLNKPGRLTDREFAFIKEHAKYGYEMIKDNENYTNLIKLGVLQHHEKINGSGYPLGVNASKISTYAKILSVVDIYDALVTERPYKQAFSKTDSIEMIMSMTETLDEKAMKSFLYSVLLYPTGTTVQLSNGEFAKVVENYPDAPMRPKVVEFKSGNVYNLAQDLSVANIVIV